MSQLVRVGSSGAWKLGRRLVSGAWKLMLDCCCPGGGDSECVYCDVQADKFGLTSTGLTVGNCAAGGGGSYKHDPTAENGNTRCLARADACTWTAPATSAMLLYSDGACATLVASLNPTTTWVLTRISATQFRITLTDTVNLVDLFDATFDSSTCNLSAVIVNNSLAEYGGSVTISLDNAC